MLMNIRKHVDISTTCWKSANSFTTDCFFDACPLLVVNAASARFELYRNARTEARGWKQVAEVGRLPTWCRAGCMAGQGHWESTAHRSRASGPACPTGTRPVLRATVQRNGEAPNQKINLLSYLKQQIVLNCTAWKMGDEVFKAVKDVQQIKVFGSGMVPHHCSSCCCCCCCCWGDALQKASGSVVSNRIGVKFGRIVPQANTHRLIESDFWYDVIFSRWPLAAASAGFPLTRWARVTSLARCMRYSSWSIVYSYLFSQNAEWYSFR